MPLIDSFGRQVDYLRVSVTDRCNFRCIYCMAEDMTFVPKSEVLSLEEIYRLVASFVSLGVHKVRLTGGEPLVRHNICWLAEQLGALPGLNQLALTTNAALLPKYAVELKQAGVTRLNISIDTLQEDTFTHLTRFGRLADVLAGIAAAKDAGFSNMRLNAVILKGINDNEVQDLIAFAQQNGCDLAFIEEMPLGEVGRDRPGEMVSNADLHAQIEHQLRPLDYTSGGPARYYLLATDAAKPIRIGFISPHSHNFCASCNRVRLTAEGRLLLCLGNEHSIDLRGPLRAGATDKEIRQLITEAMQIKPKQHEFN